ncbi:retrotransposon protein, putative, ty1-copia subclass, partial [Tanacetum coccineum]
CWSNLHFPEFYTELEAKTFGAGAQRMGLQLIQLELRLGKILSRSFRPVKSAEILWQFWASSSFGISLAHDGSWSKTTDVMGGTMAANQTTNNNSIRSILDKEKLNGSNFLDRYHNLRIVLKNEQKLHHLEEALPEAPPATATAAVRNAYTLRVAEQQEVACLMLVSMTPKIQKNLEDRPAFRILQELKTIFQQQAKRELFETVKAFHACKQEEGPWGEHDCIPKKTPAVLAIRQGQIQKSKSQARGKGKSKLAYDPKHKIPPSAKKEHPAKDTECIFTIELFSFPKSNSWIYDTGCGTHICNTIQGLRGYRKLNKGALNLYVGNGNTAVVEAIGSYDLILPSGMILVLDNSSKDNICYFNAFPRSLNTDGLLESIDDESFDVCVSCISGKMARKPFTHASERADDLLGIIHSDVCGPFRTTSREGANYYITFTDDFSRYGYVYLIKHKHDVFEMFKTFQNKVENQLGKTIKALRSDRGGEYLSQEFLDHLRSRGIISQLTPPYTPQHNGVSERRNRTLLDMVRSMMSLTTLPMSFEGYALVSATRILIGSNKEGESRVKPPNYRAELSDLESKKWLEAMNAEMQSMKDNQVWNLVDLPPNCKTVGSKWLLKKKTVMDGNIHTYKAHLIAKGFTQTYRVDYEDTFSPVTDRKAIRILIAIAAYYDYEIWQMNVKIAFLNGRLNEDVYMVANLRFGESKSIMDEYASFKDPFMDLSKLLGAGTRDLMRKSKSAVIGKDSKLITTAMYSMEAEYIAAAKAAMEAIWIRKFISGLGVAPSIDRPMDMYCDNTCAITIADEPGVQKGAKHFR